MPNGARNENANNWPLGVSSCRNDKLHAATKKSPQRCPWRLVCQFLALYRGGWWLSHVAPRRGPGSWIATPPPALQPNPTAQPLKTTPALAGLMSVANSEQREPRASKEIDNKNNPITASATRAHARRVAILNLRLLFIIGLIIYIFLLVYILVHILWCTLWCC